MGPLRGMGCRWERESLQENATTGRAVLVAASVILRGNQDQARAGDRRFGARGAAESRDDAENQGVRGENAESNGRHHGEEEDQGHH